MNIILIGMPASGKSCMGRSLAKAFKKKNVDSDKLIEEKTGRKLQEIISSDGIETFKRIEEEVLCLINDDNLVISTGGSAVYSERAMEHLGRIGIIVYLHASLETIVDRLGDFSKRGVVLAEGQTIADLYSERCALYEKYANVTVSCDGNNYNKSLERAIKTIKMCIARK